MKFILIFKSFMHLTEKYYAIERHQKSNIHIFTVLACITYNSYEREYINFRVRYYFGVK